MDETFVVNSGSYLEMENEDVKKPTSNSIEGTEPERFGWIGKGSITSPMRVLLLRHPKEKKAALGTATLLEHVLTGVTLKTGLSWRNLKHALGDESAENKRWAVLFLGTKKNFTLGADEALGLFDSKGKRVQLGDSASGGIDLDGIVALDGTWRDVKGMWWKNSWLLKLYQIQLNPTRPSQYGELRRAPRKENLSTLEAVGMTLSGLSKNPELEDTLGKVMQKFLEKARD